MKQYFFTIILPIMWATVSFVSYFHPGDEYGMYVYCNIIGVWPYFIFHGPAIQSLLFPTMAAVTGGLIMAAVGFGLDKLRVNQWFWGISWLIISVLLFFLMINQYPTIQKALSKNGSWTAYIAGAINCAIYLSVLVSIGFWMVTLQSRRIISQKLQEQK